MDWNKIVFSTNQWNHLLVKCFFDVHASGCKCESAVVVGCRDACQPSCRLCFDVRSKSFIFGLCFSEGPGQEWH